MIIKAIAFFCLDEKPVYKYLSFVSFVEGYDTSNGFWSIRGG